MTQTAWVLTLSQFYLSLGFMLFFLALELGLAWILFGLRLSARRSQAARLAYRFWVRIFALSVIVSFAASIPLLLQFGTLWPGFMDRAGEVVGPLLALAVLIAFVFKSCFLGAMLYGHRSLSDWAHRAVVGMVALGISLVAYCIATLMAWLQQPVGVVLVEGRYQLEDWAALVRGVAPTLFGLLLTAGLMLASALMLAIVAWRTRVRPSDEGDRCVFAGSLRLLWVSLLLQAALAATLGHQLLPVQPGRAAAITPHWSALMPEHLSLMAWPDADQGRNRWVVPGPDRLPPWFAPAAGTPRPGLNDMVGIHPPIWATYLSVRLAVLLTALFMLVASWAWWRGHRLGYEPDRLRPAGRRMLRILLWGVVLLQAVGWGHLLLGSLPYAVYGALNLHEIGNFQRTETLFGIFAFQLVIYGALALGFRQLLLYTSRYGVVPVGRQRGHA